MCQIVPFTLPCCRRTYVSVEKLPSCPDAWPKKKCPQDLCIQIRGYFPERRVTGMCWRCRAQTRGEVGEARESMRPVIDDAVVVVGLEELDVPRRKSRAEEKGNCWYCGAKKNCKSCKRDNENEDSAPIIREEQDPPPAVGKKRGRDSKDHEDGKDKKDKKGKGKVQNKRVKLESIPEEPGNSTPVFTNPFANQEQKPQPQQQHWSNTLAPIQDDHGRHGWQEPLPSLQDMFPGVPTESIPTNIGYLQSDASLDVARINSNAWEFGEYEHQSDNTQPAWSIPAERGSSQTFETHLLGDSTRPQENTSGVQDVKPRMDELAGQNNTSTVQYHTRNHNVHVFDPYSNARQTSQDFNLDNSSNLQDAILNCDLGLYDKSFETYCSPRVGCKYDRSESTAEPVQSIDPRLQDQSNCAGNPSYTHWS